MKKSLILVVALALVSGAAFAQTSLNVDPAAAMGGTTQGLEVIFDTTDTSAAFVRDDSPADDTVYRAGFWIDPNDTERTNGNTGRLTSVFLARGGNFGQATAGRIIVQLQRFNNNNDLYRIRAVCADNTNLTRRRARDPITNAYGITIADEPVFVTVESVFAGQQGGECRIRANGELNEQTGYTSSFGDVEQVFFGAPRDIAPLTGTVYLDEFSSFRTLAP